MTKKPSIKNRAWEKERRDRLNAAMDKLGLLLLSSPGHCHKQFGDVTEAPITLSKIEIVQRAIEIVESLQQQVRDLLAGSHRSVLESQRQLENALVALQARNATLGGALKKAKITVPPFVPPPFSIRSAADAQSVTSSNRTDGAENNGNGINLLSTVGRPPKHSQLIGAGIKPGAKNRQQADESPTPSCPPKPPTITTSTQTTAIPPAKIIRLPPIMLKQITTSQNVGGSIANVRNVLRIIRPNANQTSSVVASSTAAAMAALRAGKVAIPALHRQRPTKIRHRRNRSGKVVPQSDGMKMLSQRQRRQLRTPAGGNMNAKIAEVESTTNDASEDCKRRRSCDRIADVDVPAAKNQRLELVETSTTTTTAATPTTDIDSEFQQSQPSSATSTCAITLTTTAISTTTCHPTPSPAAPPRPSLISELNLQLDNAFDDPSYPQPSALARPVDMSHQELLDHHQHDDNQSLSPTAAFLLSFPVVSAAASALRPDDGGYPDDQPSSDMASKLQSQSATSEAATSTTNQLIGQCQQQHSILENITSLLTTKDYERFVEDVARTEQNLTASSSSAVLSPLGQKPTAASMMPPVASNKVPIEHQFNSYGSSQTRPAYTNRSSSGGLQPRMLDFQEAARFPLSSSSSSSSSAGKPQQLDTAFTFSLTSTTNTKTTKPESTTSKAASTSLTGFYDTLSNIGTIPTAETSSLMAPIPPPPTFAIETPFTFSLSAPTTTTSMSSNFTAATAPANIGGFHITDAILRPPPPVNLPKSTSAAVAVYNPFAFDNIMPAVQTPTATDLLIGTQFTFSLTSCTQTVSPATPSSTKSNAGHSQRMSSSSAISNSNTISNPSMQQYNFIESINAAGNIPDAKTAIKSNSQTSFTPSKLSSNSAVTPTKSATQKSATSHQSYNIHHGHHKQKQQHLSSSDPIMHYPQYHQHRSSDQPATSSSITKQAHVNWMTSTSSPSTALATHTSNIYSNNQTQIQHQHQLATTASITSSSSFQTDFNPTIPPTNEYMPSFYPKPTTLALPPPPPPPLPSASIPNTTTPLTTAVMLPDDAFAWSPNKLLDASTSSSTLPTLHGDLALNTFGVQVRPHLSAIASTRQQRQKSADKTTDGSAVNRFSVSHLVDQRTKPHADSQKPSSLHGRDKSGDTKPQQRNHQHHAYQSYQQQSTNHQLQDQQHQKSANTSIGSISNAYSAEALLASTSCRSNSSATKANATGSSNYAPYTQSHNAYDPTSTMTTTAVESTPYNYYPNVNYHPNMATSNEQQQQQQQQQSQHQQHQHPNYHQQSHNYFQHQPQQQSTSSAANVYHHIDSDYLGATMPSAASTTAKQPTTAAATSKRSQSQISHAYPFDNSRTPSSSSTAAKPTTNVRTNSMQQPQQHQHYDSVAGQPKNVHQKRNTTNYADNFAVRIMPPPSLPPTIPKSTTTLSMLSMSSKIPTSTTATATATTATTPISSYQYQHHQHIQHQQHQYQHHAADAQQLQQQQQHFGHIQQTSTMSSSVGFGDVANNGNINNGSIYGSNNNNSNFNNSGSGGGGLVSNFNLSTICPEISHDHNKASW